MSAVLERAFGIQESFYAKMRQIKRKEGNEEKRRTWKKQTMEKVCVSFP